MNLNNKQLLRILLILSIFSLSVYGADSGAIGDFYIVMTQWVQGNLGKVIALIGFLFNYITYVFKVAIAGSGITQASAKFPIRGCFISLIAGGIVGITQMFFNLGSITF